jgi:hypothetical protein
LQAKLCISNGGVMCAAADYEAGLLAVASPSGDIYVWTAHDLRDHALQQVANWLVGVQSYEPQHECSGHKFAICSS